VIKLQKQFWLYLIIVSSLFIILPVCAQSNDYFTVYGTPIMDDANGIPIINNSVTMDTNIVQPTDTSVTQTVGVGIINSINTHISGNSITITTLFTNTGTNSYIGMINEIIIADSKGTYVTDSTTLPLNNLVGPGESMTFAQTFNDLTADDYTVISKMLDNTGVVIDTKDTKFSIVSSSVPSTQLPGGYVGETPAVESAPMTGPTPSTPVESEIIIVSLICGILIVSHQKHS
jgi:hypothetical protein